MFSKTRLTLMLQKEGGVFLIPGETIFGSESDIFFWIQRSSIEPKFKM